MRALLSPRNAIPDAQFLLVGDEAELGPLFDRYPAVRDGVHVRHTEESVGDEDKPSQALRHGTHSSMRVAVDAVRGGEAAGVVSAGNTGALMAMAKFVLKTLPGIDRPAMVGFFPTRRNESCMLDLGANVDCDANTLVQFAVMGAAFARIVLGIARPTVGLLNVGVEELKGNDAVKTAGQMLKEADLPMDFFGFVEGDDLAAGTVDVFVTDGFTGNVALKTAEGTARLYTSFLASAFRRSLLSRIGYLLAKPALESLRKRVDPRVYNGAVFVGLNGSSSRATAARMPWGSPAPSASRSTWPRAGSASVSWTIFSASALRPRVQKIASPFPESCGVPS